MHQHRQHLDALLVIAALLPRPYRAFDNRVDDLEMRRVESERDVHVAAGGLHVGGEALVILDVAGALQLVEVVITLELFKQLFGRLAENIDEYVDAAAVRHADDDLVNPGGTALVNQVVEHRDQAVAALEREALLADVACVQVALDALSTGQLLEDRQPLLVAERPGNHVVLKVLTKPEPLPRAGDVRKLDRRFAAIDGPE